jgi:prefoldin subunit 5
MKKKKFNQLIQKPLRFHHQDIHEELDHIKRMIQDVKDQMQELQQRTGIPPSTN